MKQSVGLTLLILTLVVVVIMFSRMRTIQISVPHVVKQVPTTSVDSDPLTIESMQQKSYPGSPLIIEHTLAQESNYTQYIASYQSDGVKQYGLLTVPLGQKPTGGWPVIVLNHGYIPPDEYSTVSSYISMVAPFAIHGYIVFKPDYRGNGMSEGTPVQPYISPEYVTDSMNAINSVKHYKDANPQKIGVIGHSMGGNITLHDLIMTKDIKAAVILSGVVGDESALLTWWQERLNENSISGNDLDTFAVIQKMLQTHGTPSINPTYWNSIDPTNYISHISAPIQIHVGESDTIVPIAFSQSFYKTLKKAGKQVELFTYPGADHNLSPDQSLALMRSIQFFDTYVKGGEQK